MGVLAERPSGWFTCTAFGVLPLVASPSTPPTLSFGPLRAEPAPGKRAGKVRGASARLGQGSLRLIQGSLSGGRVERQSPLLASLHRVSTGALIGLGVSLVGLSALALHWQNQWAKSYAQLEAAKVLEHRLHESAALLEQHHIGSMRRPGQLLPTSSENLIHLPEPSQTAPKRSLPLLGALPFGGPQTGQPIHPLPAGY
jgi:hypothetical protein